MLSFALPQEITEHLAQRKQQRHVSPEDHKLVGSAEFEAPNGEVLQDAIKHISNELELLKWLNSWISG